MDPKRKKILSGVGGVAVVIGLYFLYLHFTVVEWLPKFLATS